MYGDHRLIGKNAPYEPAIRVPLLIRGPAIPANTARDQLVNNLDVVATIEDISGVVPDLVSDGRSLVPLYSSANAPWRSAILVEGGDETNSSRRFAVVRTQTRKYVNYADGFEELYDLSADPFQLQNQISGPAYASDLSHLRVILEELRSCSGPTCWAS